MLNAAPVANDDSHVVGEDHVLRLYANLPSGVVPQRFADNGHYYALITNRLTAPQAVVAAQGFNYRDSSGHLVTITSATERDFLFSAFSWPSDRTRTIGLTDTEVEGVFRWVTGEPVAYTAWAGGEPNHTNDSEDYVEMMPNRLWNDNNAIDLREYIVEFDGPFLNGVLANDTDADGNPLTAMVVTAPQHGTLALNTDGVFTYTPTQDFAGTDTVTYKANDGQADSNVATVTITVVANTAPVAAGDSYTVAEDTALSTITSLPTVAIRWADNGHYYAHMPGLINSWRNAETAAATMRYLGSPGHLVTLTSQAEKAFLLSSVINQLPQNSRIYAGLTDRDVEGAWKWLWASQ